MCIIAKYKTINEWKQKNPIDMKPRRELIDMVVLDDEGFDTLSLNCLNFKKIRVMDKFNDVSDFLQYNVILCDIKGIGKSLDSSLEGIAVARQIKINYPEKIVLQYSGQSVLDYDPEFYDNMIIDGFINKNISTAQLAIELDNRCGMLWNPIDAWEYIEKSLRRIKIDNKNIAYFEHLYVKSLEKKKNYLDSRKSRIDLRKVYQACSGLVNFAIAVIKIYMELK